MSARLGVCLVVLLLVAGCTRPDAPPATSTTRTTSPPAPSPPAPSAPSGGFSDTSVFAGSYVMRDGHSWVLKQGPYAIGADHVEEPAIGRDGAIVQVGYVLPEPLPEGGVPVIVMASPYYSPLDTVPLRDAHNGNPTQAPRFLIDNYVPHGYGVAFVALRGTAGNGGCYMWWSADERFDLHAALDWIVSQEWADGELGMFGLSLAGAAAWMAAPHPHVRTIVPVSSETDLYTWFTRNGTVSMAAQGGVPAFWFLYGISPFTASEDPVAARDPEMWPESVCPEAADAVAASQYLALTAMPDDPQDFIAPRDLRPHLAGYGGSIFLVTGLEDWLAHPHLVYPWVNSLDGVVVKHLLGQWRHRLPDDATGAPYFQPTLRPDFAEILLHWWDYWLKGNTSVDLGPRVQVADSALQWRNEDAWPPAAAPRLLYPTDDGSLADAPGDGTALVVPDPRRAAARTDDSDAAPCQTCLRYRMTPEADLRIAGIPRLHVTATPYGPAATLTAYLYSDGDRIGWGTMDLRFRDGPSLDPLTPGTAVMATIAFEPMDAIVPADAELMLEIFQGGYGEDQRTFPAQALAPAAYYRSTGTAPVDLDLAGTHLDLPTIDPPASAFFTPPACDC